MRGDVVLVVGELDVVGHVQVQIAVASMSRKQTPAPTVCAFHAGRPRHVGERAVAVVAVEHVRPEVVQVQVGIAVVVVVAGSHAQSVVRVADARSFRHVHEAAPAHVAVERVAGWN